LQKAKTTRRIGTKLEKATTERHEFDESGKDEDKRGMGTRIGIEARHLDGRIEDIEG
jgi:hypothetical protein